MKCLIEKTAPVLLALAASMVAIAPLAAADTPAFQATLATPVKAGTVTVMGGTRFVCADTGCVAAQEEGQMRSIEVCADLARRTGGLVAFQARGRDFSERTLAMCNRKGGVGG